MTQIVKFVDVSKSYAVIDPNAFAENLAYTVGEDNPEKAPPIMAFAGYNFLPTSYGYRSFFGTNATLDISQIPTRCSKVFLYQFANLQNILIALCEDGIYTTRATVSGATWSPHSVDGWTYHDWLGGRGFIAAGGEEAVENAADNRAWTVVIMSNTLYIYRSGDATVAKIGSTDITAGVVTITRLTPTFLNMAGQMGIFRANGRLGFWDSANSISWSSLFDPMDHTPALETLAGNAIFKDVTGRIITILSQGEGFIIYTTRGIVGVRFTVNGPVPWEATNITEVAGIAYPFQVTAGVTDAEHFAFTSVGIYRIGKYSAVSQAHQFENVIPDVYDMLKESREPVYLSFINGRYLFISLISNKYLVGGVDFDTHIIGDLTIRILMNDGGWDGVDLLPITVDSRYYETEVYVPGDIIPPDYSTAAPSTSTVYHTDIETHLSNQVNGIANVNSAGWVGLNGERITMGVYLKWRGTGRAMFDGRDKANIYPYTLDENSNHVRNTPIQTTKTLRSDLTDLSDLTLADLDAFVPDNTSVTMEGGWMYPGPNLIDSTVLGNLDLHSKEMSIVQMQEWDNFEVIMQANYDALNALTNAGSSTEVEIHYTLGAANDAVEALILTKMLSADSTRTATSATYTDFEKDVLGVGTADTVPVHSGVGTHQATYRITRTWTGGKRIKLRKTSTYTVGSRAISATPVGQSRSILTGPNRTGGSLSWPDVSGNITVGYGATAAIAYANAFIALMAFVPDTFTIPDNGAGVRIEYHSPVTYLTGGTWYAKYTEDNYSIATGNLISSGTATPYTSSFSGSTPTEYYITDTAVYSLQQSTLPEYTYESEMSLTQKVLDWGVADLDPLVPDEYYDPDAIGQMPKYRFGPGEMKKFSNTAGAYTIPAISIPAASYPPGMDVLYPGSTFLIQDGSNAPLYPTFVGAFVLDTALKKWGKMYNDHKTLFDIAPVNATTPYIPYTNFGIDMGILQDDGYIRMMDSSPASSRITYGKIGFYRAGLVEAQEVRAHFREPFSGSIIDDCSLDGRLADFDTQTISRFNGVSMATAYPGNIGVWHTVTIAGNYDLQYLEFRGTIAGRRGK